MVAIIRRFFPTSISWQNIMVSIGNYQLMLFLLLSIFFRMIEDAEEKGLISPGVTTLVEPTSGNLGLGLILIALSKGYRFVAVMPGQYSLDKQILLRYMGAELFLTGKIDTIASP
jgi:cysteine synthase